MLQQELLALDLAELISVQELLVIAGIFLLKTDSNLKLLSLMLLFIEHNC